MKKFKGIGLSFLMMGSMLLSALNPLSVKAEDITPSTGVLETNIQSVEDTSRYEEYKGTNYLIVGSSNQGPPTQYGSFKNDSIINDWINSYSYTGSDISLNSKVKLGWMDLNSGNTEGNSAFIKATNKFALTTNFLYHLESVKSGRSIDNAGSVNSGLSSGSCFTNRPKDSIVNPICTKVFAQNKITLNQFGKMSDAEKKAFLLKTKLPLYLTNYNSSVMKQSAKELLKHSKNLGMNDQDTSISIYYIDQINQLGLSGAKRLVTIDRKYKNYTKQQSLQAFRKLGITDRNGIFTTGYGAQIDFNTMPSNVLRLIYSRAMYLNNRGNENEYITAQPWLQDAARRWTYGSVARDYPNLTNTIKEEISKTQSNINFDEYAFEGTVGPDETQIRLEVRNKLTRKLIYTKNYPIIRYAHFYTDQKVATADAIRRYGNFPQNIVELNTMLLDVNNFYKERFYPIFK
jgi:hypothetical protein